MLEKSTLFHSKRTLFRCQRRAIFEDVTRFKFKFTNLLLRTFSEIELLLNFQMKCGLQVMAPIETSDACGMQQQQYSPCSEVHCGSLTLVRPPACPGASDVRVVVRVHRTSLEHFAVLYPDKLACACKPFAFVNLKHCRVQQPPSNPRTMQLVQKSCDGGVVTLRADSPNEARLWMQFLQPSLVDSSPAKGKRRSVETLSSFQLPILAEEYEE